MADYDRIGNISSPTSLSLSLSLSRVLSSLLHTGSSDPIGRVEVGYNRKGLELKHWKEMVENPRHPIVHWHVLKVGLGFGIQLVHFSYKLGIFYFLKPKILIIIYSKIGI